MMNTPLVDVIIPVHNCELFIEEAIDSILNQTMVNLRIIVVDDGSTDNTSEVVNRKIKQDHRVHLISSVKVGISAVLNLGLDFSDAPYMAFLDADDLWKSTKLEKQLAYLQGHTDESVCFTMIQEFETFNNNEGTRQFKARKEPMKGLVRGTFLGKRELIKKLGHFNKDVAVGEFLGWLSPIIIGGNEYHVISEVLTLRRIHDNNLTRQVKTSDYFDVIKAHLRAKRNNS